MKRVAVIGGGINGIMIAWGFAHDGYLVDLYEKNTLMSATSSASSKMLHGGIRYLEQGRLNLVREALKERAWWLKQSPMHAKKLELLLLVYRGDRRSKCRLRLGAALYHLLARGSGFPKGRWYGTNEVLLAFPGLKEANLVGAISYWDGQMDDLALGQWAADQARNSGVRIYERVAVSAIDPKQGSVCIAGVKKEYDLIVNSTGPWAKQLLIESDVASECSLDLVQGTHILVSGEIKKGCVLQVDQDSRIVFVLPYKGRTLIGTTERKIENPENTKCSEVEIDYLLNAYNKYFMHKIERSDIVTSFTGVRPIVNSGRNFSKASRESCLEKNRKLINVFGGKWTTSRSLAKSVLSLAQQ